MLSAFALGTARNRSPGPRRILGLQDKAVPHGESRHALDSVPFPLQCLFLLLIFTSAALMFCLPDHLSGRVLDQQKIIRHPLDHGACRLTLPALRSLRSVRRGGCRAVGGRIVRMRAGFIADGREAIILRRYRALSHPSSRARAAVAMRAIVSMLNLAATL